MWGVNLEALINSDALVKSIVENFKNIFPPEVIIFLISTLPILELRGGILAASFLGIGWNKALVICILGNLAPVPFILIFIKKIFEWMKNTRFVKLVHKLEEKAEKKSKYILKYRTLGLLIFVALPLPGAGAWTGALIAALMEMPFKSCLIAFIGGSIGAGIIMSILSYGVLGFLH